uniref:Uncharacterized protein n=1 Tax=Arion vulgaris TaxID=1028688 RepID=A0A0B7B3J5_9EUPU
MNKSRHIQDISSGSKLTSTLRRCIRQEGQQIKMFFKKIVQNHTPACVPIADTCQ